LSTTCTKESLIIAVSGKPGSGKTTLAKLLASRLGLRYISSGEIFRRIAIERGISLLELSKIAETNHGIDKSIDESIRREALKGGVVVDGHISAWILRDIAHIRVGVIAPLDVRASRISLRDSISVNDAVRNIRDIEDSEVRRFKDIYGIDVNDLSVFDIIINTSTFNPEECLDIVLGVIHLILNKCNA